MYIGILFNFSAENRNNDSLTHRVIEAWQGGKLKNAVHAAAILCVMGRPTERNTRRVVLGSSDGTHGVHVLETEIEFGFWQVYDMPFDTSKARAWFDQHIGAPYDYRAAASQTCPFWRDQAEAWNCSESVCAAVGFTDPAQIPPSVLADICATVGTNVTADFFGLAHD